jgi:aminoglycoside phosphotransferase (APT) family kinase protein
MLPPSIQQLVQQAFPGAVLAQVAPTSGGFSNQSWYATLDAQQAVIKAAILPPKREDVRREALLLPLLAAHGLPVPALLAFAEDALWSVAVTERLPGEHGLMLLGDASADLASLYQCLGAVLAATHKVALPAERGMQGLAERLVLARAALAATAVPPKIEKVLAQAIEFVLTLPHEGVLFHGDVGLHNLLWDGKQLYLLDWEWAGVGTPLLDLAWLQWTLRWRGLPPTCWQAFAASYGAAGESLFDLTADATQALMLAQIGLILARVREQPAAFAEWLRRAEWTLAETF